jgi:hypothetical protein
MLALRSLRFLTLFPERTFTRHFGSELQQRLRRYSMKVKFAPIFDLSQAAF